MKTQAAEFKPRLRHLQSLRRRGSDRSCAHATGLTAVSVGLQRGGEERGAIPGTWHVAAPASREHRPREAPHSQAVHVHDGSHTVTAPRRLWCPRLQALSCVGLVLVCGLLIGTHRGSTSRCPARSRHLTSHRCPPSLRAHSVPVVPGSALGTREAPRGGAGG